MKAPHRIFQLMQELTLCDIKTIIISMLTNQTVRKVKDNLNFRNTISVHLRGIGR